ncbi:MAG: hypothetical protein UMV23_02240 [Halanaerobium sp.]|nr:hypothetical protein [Halanaerobium sp.]
MKKIPEKEKKKELYVDYNPDDLEPGEEQAGIRKGLQNFIKNSNLSPDDLPPAEDE